MSGLCARQRRPREPLRQPRTPHRDESAAPGSRSAHGAMPGKVAISRGSLRYQFHRRFRRHILDDDNVFHLSARLVHRRSVPDLGRSPPGEPVRALSKPHFHGPHARLVEPAFDRLQGAQDRRVRLPIDPALVHFPPPISKRDMLRAESDAQPIGKHGRAWGVRSTIRSSIRSSLAFAGLPTEGYSQLEAVPTRVLRVDLAEAIL